MFVKCRINLIVDSHILFYKQQKSFKCSFLANAVGFSIYVLSFCYTEGLTVSCCMLYIIF